MKTISDITLRLWGPVYFFRRGMAYARRHMVAEGEVRAWKASDKAGEAMRARLGCTTVYGQLDHAIRQADELMEEVRELRDLLWMTEERMGIATAAKRWMEDLIGKMLEGPDGMELGRNYLKRRWAAMMIERQEDAVSQVEKQPYDADGRPLGKEEAKERFASLRREMDMIGKPVGDAPWKVRG